MTDTTAQVSLQAPNGHYVTFVGFGAQLAARSTAIGPRERFEVIAQPNGRVALRASNGRYVSVDYRAGRRLRAHATSVGDGETFRLEERGGGVVLRGLCAVVSVEAGGELVAASTQVGPQAILRRIPGWAPSARRATG